MASERQTMAAELWLVDFGSEVIAALRRDVARWLAEFDVAEMTVHESAGHAAHQAQVPCAIVGLVHSAAMSDCELMEDAVRLAGIAACLILDLSYDERLGCSLLHLGVQDYVDATNLGANELIRRIEHAVIRNEPHRVKSAVPLLNDFDWRRISDIYHKLPSREREVLDLDNDARPKANRPSARQGIHHGPHTNQQPARKVWC